MEKWKPIVGMEGWYEVSDRGRIRRIMPGKKAVPGRIVKQQTSHRGYQVVTLTMACEKRHMSVHSAVLEAFVCPRKPKMQCNHKNGQKSDNRLYNLEWATPSENISHAYRVLGFKNGHRKITETDVRFIRKNAHKFAYTGGPRSWKRTPQYAFLDALSSRLGISKRTIRGIAGNYPTSGWIGVK